MRRSMIAVGLAGILAVSGAAFAGEHGGSASAKLEKALRTAFVLSLAEDLQLDETQTLGLVKSFKQHNDSIAALRQQQESLRGELMAESGGAAALDQLIQVDQQLAQAQAQAAQQVGAELTPEQRAKVYLLLSTMDEHVDAVLGGKQPGGSHGEMADAHGAEATEAAAPPADPNVMVKEAVTAWAEGLKGQDIEKMMSPYSDAFTHYEYGDKAGMQDFLQQAIDMGYLENIEVVMDDAEIEINGDEATMYPILLNGNFGQATIEFTLKNEAGAWRITGMEMSGV